MNASSCIDPNVLQRVLVNRVCGNAFDETILKIEPGIEETTDALLVHVRELSGIQDFRLTADQVRQVLFPSAAA
jgi:hypothetical protein